MALISQPCEHHAGLVALLDVVVELGAAVLGDRHGRSREARAWRRPLIQFADCMKHVKKSVLLWYSPHEMYALVTAVEDYPKFLPWCERVEVLAARRARR